MANVNGDSNEKKFWDCGCIKSQMFKEMKHLKWPTKAQIMDWNKWMTHFICTGILPKKENCPDLYFLFYAHSLTWQHDGRFVHSWAFEQWEKNAKAEGKNLEDFPSPGEFTPLKSINEIKFRKWKKVVGSSWATYDRSDIWKYYNQAMQSFREEDDNMLNMLLMNYLYALLLIRLSVQTIQTVQLAITQKFKKSFFHIFKPENFEFSSHPPPIVEKIIQLKRDFEAKAGTYRTLIAINVQTYNEMYKSIEPYNMPIYNAMTFGCMLALRSRGMPFMQYYFELIEENTSALVFLYYADCDEAMLVARYFEYVNTKHEIDWQYARLIDPTSNEAFLPSAIPTLTLTAALMCVYDTKKWPDVLKRKSLDRTRHRTDVAMRCALAYCYKYGYCTDLKRRTEIESFEKTFKSIQGLPTSEIFEQNDDVLTIRQLFLDELRAKDLKVGFTHVSLFTD